MKAKIPWDQDYEGTYDADLYPLAHMQEYISDQIIKIHAMQEIFYSQLQELIAEVEAVKRVLSASLIAIAGHNQYRN